MGFLNGLLLLGALAFVVPLIIHLLNRSKFQTVEWGAMHLLDNLELQNSRRFQWQAWLLLLLRCLIPLVLALCMARPIWNWWMTSGVGGAATTVFVLDDSFSMQAKSNAPNDAPATLFERSLQQAQQVIAGVGGRAAKSLITSGASGTSVTNGTSYDPRPLERQLERLQPAAHSSNPAAALQLAIETAATTQDPHRQILVWSDFQKSDWENVPVATWESIREQLRQLPVPASLHFFPQRAEPTANVSLWIDSDTTELALIGEPLEMRAVVANRSETQVNSLPLRVMLNEREIAIKRVDLAPRAEQQVSFLITVEEPGDHVVRAMIDDSSGVTGDDQDELAVEAVSPIRVLLVESRNDLPLLKLETGFLQIALQSTARDDDQPRGFVVERVTADKLSPAILERHDVAVFANVTRINDNVAQSVAEQVAKGLTLLVFGGDQLDRDWYDRQWGSGATRRILPFRYGEPIDATAATNDTTTLDPNAAKAWRVAAPPYAEPALSLFNNPQQGRLDQVSVKRWHRFPADDSTSAWDVGAVPILTLDNKTPLLAKLKVDQGVVYQWSIAANDAWSDLPIRPVYFPLQQRLILFSRSDVQVRDLTSVKQEARFEPLTESELEGLAGTLGAELHNDAESFLTADSQRQTGWEIWRWVLLGVLVILFGELLIEKRITRGAT